MKKEMGNLFQHITRTIKRNNRRTVEIVEEITSMIFEESQNEVPVDTGALKGSGEYRVEKFEIGDGIQVSGTIEYGGETRTGPTRNAPEGIVFYADIVHVKHKPFLDIAYNNVRNSAVRRIRRYMKNLAAQLVSYPYGRKS